MRAAVVCFALGVLWVQTRAALPDPAWPWLAAAGLLPVAVVLRRAPVPVRRACFVVVLLASFATGVGWTAWFAQTRLGDRLEAAWEGRDIELTGVVASLPQAFDRGVRFDFDVERPHTPDARVPSRIVLTWWGRAGVDGRVDTPVVQPGERWRFTVRLKRPHGAVNPHGFDYEAWLLERGVGATGYVRPRTTAARIDAFAGRATDFVERARSALRDRIQQVLAGREYAGVIVALVMGDQRGIPPEQWQVFTRTGVNHLISISGLHVTMLSGLVYAALLAGWRRSARLILLVPAPKAAAAGGLLSAAAYTLLAGFAVPAQRTLYMLAVFAVALWLGVRVPVTAILAAALLFVLILDPWAVLAPGFWLSFGAVAVILFVSVQRVGRPHWFSGWARVQWALTVALTPLLLAAFQQVSVISPVANAMAIPSVSLLIVPLGLAGTLLPLDVLLVAAHQLMAWTAAVLVWLSDLPSAVWEQHAPLQWTVPVACVGALWLLLPRGVPARWLGVVAFLPLFLLRAPLPAPGELRATVLDVGNGLAVVLQTRHHALLYDTGLSYGPGHDSGSRVIVPYLRAAGISHLDILVLSHDDTDHVGGAPSVLAAVPADALLSSLPDLDPLPLLAPRAYDCRAGDRWTWDGVSFAFLHPFGQNAGGVRDNDRSCVLRVASAQGTLLIPGDLEWRGEAELLARNTGALRADVLLVPHHGSRTSSTEPFIDAVQPRLIVYPTGYRNRFGHPDAGVVARYEARAVPHYRTDRDGAVLLTFGADGIRSVGYRAVYRRYWHDLPASEPNAAAARHVDPLTATFY